MVTKPQRIMTVRHPDLSFDVPIPRYWMGGSPFATYLFNAANLLFPEGERYFVRAVRDAARMLGMAERAEIRAFTGQEATHAHLHEQYFDALRAQGYAIDGFLRAYRGFSRFGERLSPVSLRLAITAGAEHWTATFAAFVLDEELMLQRTNPTMRRLLVWHALEEVEHKAVAFEVLRARCPRGSSVRLLGFLLATANLVGWTIVGMWLLRRQDGLGRRRAQWFARAFHVRTGWRMGLVFRAAVCAYLRPTFHPDDRDDRTLVAAHLSEIGPLRRAVSYVIGVQRAGTVLK